MKVYFFGSPECDNCMTLLNVLSSKDLAIGPDDEFCLINAFDDKYEELCDEHEVDDLPHVKIIGENGYVVFERVGLFKPDDMNHAINFYKLNLKK